MVTVPKSSRRRTVGLILTVALLPIALARRVTAETPSPVGTWLAEDIRGGGVIDRLQTTLEIKQDGTISGNGGCNGFAGRATIENSTIRLGQIAATLMACTPAAMAQERKFFDALSATRSFRIDPLRRKLILLDADEKLTVQLAAM